MKKIENNKRFTLLNKATDKIETVARISDKNVSLSVDQNRHLTGFTLVEVIIALLVFSLGVLGVAKMLGESIRGGSFGMQYSDAVNLVQDRVEYLAGLSYTHTSLSAGEHEITGLTSGTGFSYALRWTVQDNTPVQNMKQIEVRASWSEKGIPHRATVSFVRGS